MLIATTIERVSWRPDFSSSGQSSPAWTRLRRGDDQLCNAAEWVEWDDQVVQVELCEQCGHEHCASGGYVRVSRLGRHVLWTTPRFDGVEGYSEEDARTQFAAPRAVARHGSIVFPISVWDDLSTRYRRIPHADALAPATRWDVRQAWLAEALPGARASVDVENLLRHDLIAVDQGSLEDVSAAVREFGAWLDPDRDTAVDGELIPPATAEADLVTLYLDHPDRHWPAFALVDQAPALSLGRQLVLLPGPGSKNRDT